MLPLILIVFILFSPAVVSAQEFAKKQLEASPRHHEWVEVPAGDRTVHAFVVFPQRKDKANDRDEDPDSVQIEIARNVRKHSGLLAAERRS